VYRFIKLSAIRKALSPFLQRDLNILGSIPEDQAVEQSVKEFMPVVINAPDRLQQPVLKRLPSHFSF